MQKWQKHPKKGQNDDARKNSKNSNECYGATYTTAIALSIIVKQDKIEIYGKEEVKVLAAYSYDLRQKAIQALDDGKSKTEVAKMFKIGTVTLYTLEKRRREIGDFQSKNLEMEVIITKLPTGMNLQKNMPLKHNQRWQGSGEI